jgi:flavin reductase ActVB
MTNQTVAPLPQEFRDALAAFPSGVVVVTTREEDGTPRGFTATAFASVSADPPMVLVCLATTADCYRAFAASAHFGVSILADHHSETAQAFATRGADKFGSTTFGDGDTGVPFIEEAPSVLECRVESRIPAGDHVILLGEVIGCENRFESRPLLYFKRGFHQLQEVTDDQG